MSHSAKIGDETFNEIFHPIAADLINHRDAVLRNGSASSGADEMAQSKGKPVYFTMAEIPELQLS